MTRLAAVLALGALSLAACDTIAPEDYARRLSMNWSLSPDNVEVTRRTVESGDVILSWTAKAKATHVMDTATGPISLVKARTTFGQLYCDQKTCYEDRDGDGTFDMMWDLSRNYAEPKQPQQATNPRKIKSPIAFRATQATGNAIFEQLLALVYSGPMEGVPTKEQTLLPMLGELSVGWYGGAKVPRTPDGQGWSEEQKIPLILVEGVTPRTTINPLGLTYMPVRATIDGTLELEFQARAVEDIDLDAKPKFDVEGKNDKTPADKPPPPPQT
jgi:hypothetical protein